MHKLFLAVASMIVTHFLQKAYRKITEKPADKEELDRILKAKYAEFRRREERRAEARPVIAKLDAISTPRDGEKMMAAIGSVQQMRDALCPSNDQCDAMPMGSIGRFS